MPVFTSVDELNEVMENLWNGIKADPCMAEQLLRSRLSVRFNYREPEGWLMVDCSDGKEIKISTEQNKLQPAVEMFMQSDLAHAFWLGNVNVGVALMSGKIVSKGPVDKVLALVPVVKPAYILYPQIFASTKQRRCEAS